MRNKELDAYVTKLERKLGSEKVKKGAFAAVSSTPVRRVEKESLLDALAELQEENARLHAALQVRDDNAAFHRVLEMSIGTGFYLHATMLFACRRSRRPLTSRRSALVSLTVVHY